MNELETPKRKSLSESFSFSEKIGKGVIWITLDYSGYKTHKKICKTASSARYSAFLSPISNNELFQVQKPPDKKVQEILKTKFHFVQCRLMYIYKNSIKKSKINWYSDFDNFLTQHNFYVDTTKDFQLVSKNEIESYIFSIDMFWVLLISYLCDERSRIKFHFFISVLRFCERYIKNISTVIDKIYNFNFALNIQNYFSKKKIINYCKKKNIDTKFEGKYFVSKKEYIKRIFNKKSRPASKNNLFTPRYVRSNSDYRYNFTHQRNFSEIKPSSFVYNRLTTISEENLENLNINKIKKKELCNNINKVTL